MKSSFIDALYISPAPTAVAIYDLTPLLYTFPGEERSSCAMHAAQPSESALCRQPSSHIRKRKEGSC